MNDNTVPFVCVEVEKDFSMAILTKRFEELFPNQIIRLVIDKKYSPFFYLGNKLWIYKQSKKQNLFKFKIFTNEKVEDFLMPEQLELIEFLGTKTKNIKIIYDVSISEYEIPGLFFTDGTFFFIDQYVSDQTQIMAEFLKHEFGAEIIIDATNQNNNGFIAMKLTNNILGENK